jgi:exopolysaccharide production protein ExoY
MKQSSAQPYQQLPESLHILPAPGLDLSNPPVHLGLKRLFDVNLSLFLLIFLLPLLLGITLLLLVTQGRPILFSHGRIGKNGVPFKCLKFRTMANDAGRLLDTYLAANPAARREWEAAQKLKLDPRVTPIGRVLRKLSFDELPQLLNVIRGDMSLVGPRPIVSSEARFYGPYISAYHSVRPGITGPWQVSGRSNTSYAQRVQLDVDYLQGWSLAKDFAILAKTLPAVLTSNGSC